MDKTPTEDKKRTWCIKTIIGRLAGVIIITAIVTMLFLRYQKITLTDQTGASKASVTKRPLELRKKRDIKPLETRTADALDHISQANLYTRISYYQLAIQQDPASAATWLDLARQQVQLSKSSNASDALESIAVLKEKISHLPTPNIENVQTQLNTLRARINELTLKKDNAHRPSASKTDDQPNQKAGTKILINWWQQLVEWVKNSISIQSLNHTEYQTIQHSLQSDQFIQTATQLLDQATLAASYQDKQQFGYALGKLDLLIKFSIIDPTIQQPIRQKIEILQQQPIAFKPPCYQELFTLLGQPVATEITTPQTANPDTIKAPSSQVEKNAQLIQEIST